MLIAIDIGNSSITIGYFTDAVLFVQKIHTHPVLSYHKYSALINKFIKETNMEKTPGGIIISSVVPGHTKVLLKALQRLADAEPLIVSHSIKSGLGFTIPEPDQLGSDRIANAVAAYALYRRPVAVIDFGTATTISVVGKKAAFIGGAIMPGLNLMNQSLAKGTSRLREIPIQPPASALGQDTEGCIRSGLFYGSAGAVERILQDIENAAGFRLKVVVTGGYGGHISHFLQRRHKIVPHLTLEGLRLLYFMNTDA